MGRLHTTVHLERLGRSSETFDALQHHETTSDDIQHPMADHGGPRATWDVRERHVVYEWGEDDQARPGQARPITARPSEF